MSEAWLIELKTAHLCFFSIALLAADFALAQIIQTQQGVGAEGADTGSANYLIKTVVGEPGVGRSQSANYIYDHGTTWGGFATSTSQPPPQPPPSSGGGGGGSGGGGGGGGGAPSLVISGGGSGSGIGGGGGEGGAPGIGGISPAVDEEIMEAITESISEEETAVIQEEEIVSYIEETLQTNFRKPRVIQIVDKNNVVRGVIIMLLRRVIPWPLWLALLFLIIGTFTLTRVYHDGLWYRENVWLASGLIIAGITLGWATRSIYRIDPASFGINQTTTASTVQPAQAGDVVRGIVHKKPIGVHRVTVVNGDGVETMKITIFVKGTVML